MSKHTDKLLKKQRDPRDTVVKMVFIKEESEDIRIEEVFSLKHEDTEEQTGWFLFSELTHLILIKMSISTEMKIHVEIT